MIQLIGSIATSQTVDFNKNLQKRVKLFIDYAAMHPAAQVCYIASKMHLWIHTDASYLNEPKARSQGGGFMFFSDKPTLLITPDQQAPPTNVPVLLTSKAIDALMSSAQKSEIGAGFNNARDAIPIKKAAIEVGHPQVMTTNVQWAY